MGYLWDTLKSSACVTRADIERINAQRVYVLWDLHSAQKIHIPNYWRFPKSAIVAGRWRDMLSHYRYFPADSYFFDESYEWSAIFTHETCDDAKKSRLLLVAPESAATRCRAATP